MTLVDASDQITPILKSGLLDTNEELQEKMKEVEKHLMGYELKGPTKLNQFEVLDDVIEEAVTELVDCFERITSNQ